MWDRFRITSEDKENTISQPKLIETTYDESRLSTLPTVDEARRASYAKEAPGISPFPFEKKDKVKADGRISSDSPVRTRITTHNVPEVQYTFANDKDSVLPLFANKPLPQRLSQTFDTLASNAIEQVGLGISARSSTDRPISEYDSAPEIVTAQRASRVPLGVRSTQTILPKQSVPVVKEPWRGASGSSERLTPIHGGNTPATVSPTKKDDGYFHVRSADSLTSTQPDSSDRTVEKADSLAVPEQRTWRSASTGNTPTIRIDTTPIHVARKVPGSPKSTKSSTCYNWAAKAVDRPPGTPESLSSGTWSRSGVSEVASNPTLRETAAAHSAIARTAAKASTLAPIPATPILNRKRPIPRPRDHIVEESAASVRAKAEAASREITPPVSEAGDLAEEANGDLEQTPRARTSESDDLVTNDRTPSPASIHIPRIRAREPPRDRAMVLQTELDNLTSRRRTLERLIRNITDYAPPNPLIRDLATRREEAERIGAVERELAETRRREHDIGLKLVKAWQKREFEDGAQFWVRRVTK